MVRGDEQEEEEGREDSQEGREVRREVAHEHAAHDGEREVHPLQRDREDGRAVVHMQEEGGGEDNPKGGRKK